MSNVYLSAFGGSGENGRNCYTIGVDNEFILLDCGVKREIVDGQVGFYPALTREIVSKIKAVFLSHCHEDHVAGLPLLYELGYTGKVYGTRETIAETMGFVKKWMGYVDKNHGVLPFKPESADLIRLEPLELGAQEIEGIQLETGRSGHVLGGVWYIFAIDGKRLLYTGDMCREPGVLAFDQPGACDAAIMNAAYAGKKIVQSAQFDALLNSVKTTALAGGKVLLPVPPKGRGIEIAQFLGAQLADTDIPVYVESAVEKSYKQLATQEAWIKPGILSEFPASLHVLGTDEERAAALAVGGGAVYITPDGMLSTELGLMYFAALKGDAANKVIISGHAAKGTAGAGALDDAYRAANGVKAEGEKIVFKVHMDDDDIVEMCCLTGAKQAVLFHSDAVNTEAVKARLAQQGFKGLTIQYPEKADV
ncbi:MAG: MBL fold metallo-hydrolase [Clostridia bacterium]|nr:MBL fold metallo-hydrolase [Clostridia bacterium]